MKPKFLPGLLLLLDMLIAPAVSAQESLAEWGDQLFHDGQTVVTAPLHWQEPQWQKAAGLIVITGTLMATTDQNVADYYDGHRRTQVNEVLQGVGDALSPLALAGYSAALWGTGQLVPNDALSRTAFKMGEAVVFSSVIAGGIKIAVGRARPYTGADTSDFSGWSWHEEHQSLPSAHATAAFAAARAVSPQLTPVQRLGAYSAAALVSYSRIYQGDHWLSDVVFGAGLGYSVGAVLADNTGKDHKEQAGWWIIPAPAGITLSWFRAW